jgi:hypothetical protein
VAAAWTVRSHTLKAPRAARTARGGRIEDFKGNRQIAQDPGLALKK